MEILKNHRNCYGNLNFTYKLKVKFNFLIILKKNFANF